MTVLLAAEQLTIGYGKQALGRNLNLALQSKEILALLGPNGSGKTTLFKTLLGLIKPIAGQVVLNNKPLTTCSRREIAQHIGYVPQATEGYFAFSAIDMVLMGRTAHLGVFAQPSKVDIEWAGHILSDLGIGHLAQRDYPKISGGERQLVLIARALLQQPSMLILDEPTASLDFANQIMVLEQVQQLRAKGLGVLLCTHQPEHALQVADRLALLKNGQLDKVGSLEELGTAENLAWLYSVPVEQVYAQLKRDFVQ